MNWDYIAGFFDGEGSLIYYKAKNNNRWGRGIKFLIAQKDINILKKIKGFMKKQGCVSIGIYENKGGFSGSLCYNLAVQNKHDLSIVFNAIKDKIYVKKTKLKKLLKIISSTNWLEQKRYSNKEKRDILRLWDKGHSITEISKKLGKKYLVVYHIIRSIRQIGIKKEKNDFSKENSQKTFWQDIHK